MTSPAAVDASGYVDLTLLDVDTQELVDRAVALLAVIFPDWTPGEWNTETVLVEAFALEVAELVYAINRIPGAVTEVLLRLFGLTRDPGAPPGAVLSFTTSAAGAMTIPLGTRVRLDPGDGLEPVDFLTDLDLPVAAGPGTSTVHATATAPTTTVNRTADDTPVTVVDAVAYVDAATLTIDAAGRDPEDSPAFLNRGITRLGRLVTTLVLDRQFTAAVLEDPRVTQATTLDRYDPATGPAPGDNPGHVTVVVAGLDGVPLAGDVKADLETDLEAQALAGLDVHIIDATVTALDVTTTVVKTSASVVDAQLEAAIADALEAYLDPNTRPFGGTIYRNELITLIDAIPGVARVVDVTLAGAGAVITPAGDAELAGYGPLVTLGAADVTVLEA